MIYVISGNALKNTTPLKMDNIDLKKKYSSLKIDNITVVKLKTLAKQRGIKGYYKLRKAELIHALEAVRLIEQKVTYLMSRFRMIPLQFYNQHLGSHQISRPKINKI